MSEKVDVSKFGLIFAGAQKNLGPAGVCLVIIRDDLVGKAPETIPTMMNYQTHVDNGSMFNTPPTYAIYIMGLVFQWLKKNGGIDAIEKINREKAKILYDFLDSSSLFKRKRRNRCGFHQRGRCCRFCQFKRSPQCRRYACKHLQRHAAERRAGACRFHESV